MNKIKNLKIIYQSIGIISTLFVIFPLLNSLYLYEFSTHQTPFLDNVLNVYKTILAPNDIGSLILPIVLIASGFSGGTIMFKLGKKSTKSSSSIIEILETISNGENETTEFKSSLRYDYKNSQVNKKLDFVILKSIAGFLNGNGGKLFIGVDDEGVILGLLNDYKSLKKKNKDGFEQYLISIISTSFGKDICSKVQIKFYKIKNKEICILSVKTSNRPIFINKENRTLFYLRTGNSTNLLTTKEALAYLNQ